jgi:hypothetical protein
MKALFSKHNKLRETTTINSEASGGFCSRCVSSGNFSAL